MATGIRGDGAQALSTGRRTYQRMAGRPRSGQAAAQTIADVTLGGLVESEVIPRLLLAHRRDTPILHAVSGAGVTGEETARFAPLPLVMEADELLTEVEDFLRRGVSVEAIFIKLLAPSARHLGELWEEDSCDFVAVTMGLWRLQEVMREIALRSPAIVDSLSARPAALFSPMPGDQHSFGALMVEEVFARAGWQSEVLIEPQRLELLQIIGERNFDIIGLTVSCGWPSAALADLIRSIRSVSRNPAVKVLIGGRAIIACPGLVAETGADGTAADAQSALALAQQLVTAVVAVPG